MKTIKSIKLAGIIAICFSVVTTLYTNAQEQSNKVILKSEIKWDHLNPKRGDKAPKAGTLWGDRNGTGPTGFLLKPSDGFSSPPHIHNVSYRGIVIRGHIHNDDPKATNMWMPSGSFWTQPKGEVHITSAKGSNTLAYIEIEKGPYLVLPSDEAFDSGERPVNVDERNIVWLDASDISWIEQSKESSSTHGPKVAFLWEDNQLKGKLVKLPPGYNGKIISYGSTFRSVVIDGQIQYKTHIETENKSLEPGSFFSSEGESIHEIISDREKESVIYIRTNGKFNITKN